MSHSEIVNTHFHNLNQIAKGNGINSEAALCRSLLQPVGLVWFKLGIPLFMIWE